MAYELKYSDEKQTIAEVLRKHKLPVVVKTCTSADGDYRRIYNKIEGNTEILLQHIMKVKYGHIKILEYQNKEKLLKEQGPEAVLEHDTYVGEEFYMPLKYHGKVKFTQRQGSRRKYTSIAQVIEELPRYVRVQDETVAIPTHGIGKNAIVPARTKLEVIRIFVEPSDGKTYLECSDGKSTYAFGERDRIHFKVVDDDKLYCLFELIRCKLLPRVIQFQDVATKDAVLLDNVLNSVLLTSVEGPIELLGFKDVNLLVGWVRDKQERTYKTVLLPSDMWNTELVQLRNLPSEDEKKKYVRRKFAAWSEFEFDFVEKYLYLMSTNPCHVTWLRSPTFYPPSTEDALYYIAPVTFNESSEEEETAVKGEDEDDDATNYEPVESPPPVPERHKLPQDSRKKESHDRSFLSKLFHKTPPAVPPQQHKPTSPIIKTFTSAGGNESKYEKAPLGISHSPVQQNPKMTHETVMKREEDDDEEHTYDYPNISRMTLVYEESLRKQDDAANSKEHEDLTNASREQNTITQASSAVSSPRSQYMTSHSISQTFSGQSSNIPSPEAPSPRATRSPKHEVQTMFSFQLRNTSPSQSSAEGTPKSQGKPDYVTLGMEKEEHLFAEGLTANDFFDYTVNETAHCFTYCGLGDFASKCFENSLDGRFFKTYDLGELGKDPFLLTTFQIYKVRRIIHDGWRPKVQT